MDTTVESQQKTDYYEILFAYPITYDNILVYGLYKSYEPDENLDNHNNKWYGTFSVWDIRNLENGKPKRIGIVS